MSVFTPKKPEILIPNWTSQAAKRGQSYDTMMKNLNWYLRNEVNLEKHNACKRDMIARKKARMVGNKTIDGLGKPIAHIPMRDMFRAMQDFGHECMDDKVFIKEWIRDNPSHRAQSS